MPPVTRNRKLKKGFWKGSTSNRKPKAAAKKRSLMVFPKAISAARGRALINVNNRTPKTMDVLLSYKQMIRITANQQDLPTNPLASGFPFRISLNSPFNPGGEILHIHTAGTVGQKSYATVAASAVPNNLTGALAATGLPDKYRYFYIKKAVVDIVVQNQINQEGLRETFDNTAMVQQDNDRSTYLSRAERTLTGELLNCCHVTEDNSFNLNPITVNSIRNDIQGSQVKESLCFPDSQGRSNRFKYVYTPKKRFDMSDIRDNLGKIRMEKDGSITHGYESMLNCCVGKQLFPSTQALDSALQTVDIRVQYLVTAYERLQDVGSNDAIPVHRGEL